MLLLLLLFGCHKPCCYSYTSLPVSEFCINGAIQRLLFFFFFGMISFISILCLCEPTILLRGALVCNFSLLHNIVLHECTTIYISVPLFMDIWILPSFCPLCIKLLSPLISACTWLAQPKSDQSHWVRESTGQDTLSRRNPASLLTHS